MWRRLHRDKKLNTVSWIDPEIWCHLRAAAQVHQHVLCDVALIQTLLREQGAVHVEIKRGRVEGLMDEHVGCAGDARNALADFLRHGVIGVALVARDLDVNRRGQAEVKNLRHDVGGLEKESQIGKLGPQIPT